MQGARASRRAFRRGQRFVHDLTDGADAPAALRTTAQASINLPCGAWLSRAYGAAHLAVAQHIAGTDDHRELTCVRQKRRRGAIELPAPPREVKEKRSL